MIRATAQVSFGVSSREKEKEETYTANNHLPKTNKGTSEWAPAPSEVQTDSAVTMRCGLRFVATLPDLFLKYLGLTPDI
jgi:hypothetical protein